MQMPLGFGNAVVLQTMFSKLMTYCISGMVDNYLFSRLGFSLARVADGCWNGVRPIVKGFRFVDICSCRSICFIRLTTFCF